MKVGQKVRIRAFNDKFDKFSPEVANKVGEVGIVKEPKIVDGGMGYVVAFNDNVTSWFFHDELEEVF